MKVFFLSLFVCFGSLLMAQTLPTDSSAVVIHKDPRVDVLLKKQADINLAIKKASARTARGYRLLVVNSTKKDEATAAKSKIYTSFPDLKAYMSYQSPYFKLKVGNFRTRDEAQEYQKLLSVYFPKGIFIVNDIIEVTPEKENADSREQ